MNGVIRDALLLVLAFESMTHLSESAPRFATSPDATRSAYEVEGSGPAVSLAVIPGLSHLEELSEIDRVFETEVAFTRRWKDAR